MIELRSYQKRGVGLIENQSTLMLAWPMGTGKSFVVVEYVRRHRPEMTLILCPKNVVRVWRSQFRKHAPGESIHVVALGKAKSSETISDRLERARRETANAKRAGWPVVLVLNYDAAWRGEMGKALIKPTWDLVVADEAHRLKSASSRQSQWASKLKAKKKVALTGTPMPHSPLDVFGEYRFLDPSIYGKSWTRFRTRYAVMGGYHHNGRPVQVVGYKNLDELQERFYRIADRVAKEEALDLPPYMHDEVMVQLSKKGRRVYDQIEGEFVAEVKEGMITAKNALGKIVRLQQVTAGFGKLESGGLVHIDDAKIEALDDYVDMLEPDEPVVVFSFFVESLRRIREFAKRLGRPFYEISGRRDDVGEVWRPEPGGIAGIQMSAGSEGIDLTAAAYAFVYDQTHNRGRFEQATDRLHRHGQHRPVTYYHLIAERTVDGVIRKATVDKADIARRVLADIGGLDKRAADEYDSSVKPEEVDYD